MTDERRPRSPDHVSRLSRASRSAGSQRVGWSLVDQGLSSASNLVLALAVARSVPSVDFGAFGLAVATYILAIGVARALTSEPFLVRHSTSTPEKSKDTAGGSAATSALIGLALGSVLVLGGLLVGPGSPRPLYAVSAFLPALLLQDHWRYVLVAQRRPRSAALNDLTWLILQLLGTVLLIVDRSTRSSTNWILMWGTGGAMCSVLGAWQCGAVPNFRKIRSWFHAERHLMAGFVAEFAFSTGSAPVTLIGLGAIGGLRAVAGIRGAQTLFGPFYVVSAGALLALIAEGSRIATSRPRQLPIAMSVAGGSLGLAAIGVTGLLTILPTSLGHAILGETWSRAHSVVPLYGIGVAFSGATIGAICGLRALQAVKISLRCRLIAGPLLFGLPLLGAAIDSAPGYVIGWSIGAGINMGVLWKGFSIALRAPHHDRRPDLSEVQPRGGR